MLSAISKQQHITCTNEIQSGSRLDYFSHFGLQCARPSPWQPWRQSAAPAACPVTATCIFHGQNPLYKTCLAASHWNRNSSHSQFWMLFFPPSALPQLHPNRVMELHPQSSTFTVRKIKAPSPQVPALLRGQISA